MVANPTLVAFFNQTFIAIMMRLKLFGNRAVDRQTEGEGGSLAFDAADADSTTMRFNDGFTDV